MKTIISTLILASGVFACSEPAPTVHQYQLQFDAIDDRGGKISGVQIAVGETRIGATNQRGSLQAEVNAGKGERFPLHVTCPDTYKMAAAPEYVLFRDTKGLEGEKHARISVQLECARHERVAALLVHADGRSDLPVLIDGVERGRTGPGGFAHVRLDLPPGAQFQVAIDSSEHPDLRPVDPKRTMTLGAEDGLFVFDPVFSEIQPVKKKRRRRAASPVATAPEKRRPVRID